MIVHSGSAIAIADWTANRNFELYHPQYISVGHAYANYHELRTHFQVPMDSTLHRDALYDPKKHFVATNFSGQGMSGGGAFNSDGELTGITIAKPTVYGSWYAQGLSPMTTYISVPYIRARVESALGEKAATEIFNCP